MHPKEISVFPRIRLPKHYVLMHWGAFDIDVLLRIFLPLKLALLRHRCITSIVHR